MVGYDNKKYMAPGHTCVSVVSTEDTLSESLPRQKTWGNDSIKTETKWQSWRNWVKWKTHWNWSLHELWLRSWDITKVATWFIISMPFAKHTRRTRRQIRAFWLVVLTTVLPLVLLGMLAPMSTYPFGGVFADKIIGCGNQLSGTPQNSTITGIEKVFALDHKFGSLSFAQAKTLDIAWDVFVGRGAQLIAWWVAYTVFCDALLRAIERHPASFSIFQCIALEGPSLGSLWTLMKELWAAKCRWTKALFFYMFWSTAYVLLVPIILGAMTGYDSTAIAWISLESDNNILPVSMLELTWVVEGTINETWPKPACADEKLYEKYSFVDSYRRSDCDCQLSNGTILPAPEISQQWSSEASYRLYKYGRCSYDFPNNNQTWKVFDGSLDKFIIHPCNSSVPVTIEGKTYDAQDLKGTTGYCYNSVGYNDTSLAGKTRCLPDTAAQTYQWGFSTLMSGLFVFATTGWVVSMYALWQDAQINSTLVKEGYQMTPLRAAFLIVQVARHRTGLSGKQLIRAETKGLERELYGKDGLDKTDIGFGAFYENAEEGEAEGKMEWETSVGGGTAPCSPTAKEPMMRCRRSKSSEEIQVISDEDVRERYRRGVEEARLGR
ncbi:hypothetical protein PTT_17807 [Pyrenophora teres f. teres 0-1]|uniref:Uncharacterized protein n=2 Tax=Pyrenophora teres f. teres TaxID=97479 RepID=E3S5A9_PYRTT|nr:hypothetical protein PTT_17807 [Pyrenophora teres f. teres 0-1]CAE7009338.1 hypothetical protein PTTW11_01822 [Pyrenophora teres f. teres]